MFIFSTENSPVPADNNLENPGSLGFVKTQTNRGIYIRVFAFMLVIFVVFASLIFVKGRGNEIKSEKGFDVVASFYPIYVIGLNLTEGVEGVSMTNLTPFVSGCLHDFQMSPEQMLRLGEADIFLTNGGGAESFLEKAVTRYPALKVVDSSVGILLKEASHSHAHEGEEDEGDHGHYGHEHDEHDHEDEGVFYNEHIWTDPVRYLKQIDNLAEGLAKYDPANAEKYHGNAEKYKAKVQTLIDAYFDRDEGGVHVGESIFPVKETVIFHDTLDYFAESLGFEVVAALSIGEDEQVSAFDLSKIERTVSYLGNNIFMYDSQYPVLYKNIANDKTKFITIDAAVIPAEGVKDIEGHKNSWLNAMEKNLKDLRALYN